MSILSSQTTAMRVASLITAINVLTAVGFSIAGLINPTSILRHATFRRTPRSYSPCTLRPEPYHSPQRPWLRSTSVRGWHYRSWARWRESYKCWTPVSACTSVILGNPSDRLLLPRSSFWRSTS
jgi:hypothetical protein